MRWARFYTQHGRDPVAGARFRTVSTDPWQEYVIPQHWNQAAAEVLQQKIFYARALPSLTRKVAEDAVPEWLWRSEVDHAALESVSGEWRYRVEKDVRDVLHRVAGSVTYRAWKNGAFSAEEGARVFYDELRYILLYQLAAPEPALWASLGLDWAYGLTDEAVFVPHHNITLFDASAPHAFRRIKALAETQAVYDTPEKVAVTLPVENIDSLPFISWKKDAELRRVAENVGRRTLEAAAHEVMDACDRDDFSGGFDPSQNDALQSAVDNARQAGLPETAIRRAINYAEQGYESLPQYAPEEGRHPEIFVEAVLSVTDDFVESALTGHELALSEDDAPKGSYPAEKLWDTLAEAVWSSGEPAISFRDSINAAKVTDSRSACQASGGFVFIPGSAAPSATINLLVCDVEGLQHVVTIMTVMLDAAVTDRDYRPVVLGVTNMAAALMSRGLAYDSEAGRVVASLLTALVSGVACRTSTELARSSGSYPAYPAQVKEYLQFIKDKLAALAGATFLKKGMTRRPVQLRTTLCPDTRLVETVRQVWEEVYSLGKEVGFRNAHLTGVNVGCDMQALLNAQTQGIAPETALVRFECGAASPDNAAYARQVNPMVPRALAQLGYDAAEIEDIDFYAAGHGTLLDAPHISHKALREKGFHQAALDALEVALATSLHIRYAFNKWTLGEDFCSVILGFPAEDMGSLDFDMLTALGFTEEQIEAANLYCCGAMSLEGAPHLKPAHLAVFDCATPVSAAGARCVSPEAQVKMQAAVEVFLSGAAAHRIVLSHYTTVSEVQKLVLAAWEMGVKTLRLYREGCSLLHPLALPLGKNDMQNEEETEECHKQSMRA